MNWARVRPTEIAWEQFHDPHGRPTTPVRILKSGDVQLLQAQFSANFEIGVHWHPFDTIYIITRGEMSIGDEGIYRPGDLRWVKAGHAYGPERAGAEGVEFYLISLGGEVGLNWADLYDVPPELNTRLTALENHWGRINLDDVAWQEFADPAGRPTQPVQLLFNDDPYVLRTRFEPGYVAGEHWHDYDTIYFITRGRMRFGAEGWYEAGDIRWVDGGHSYGPEEPGEEGVEFLLVSCGGPVNLHWADLEPAPNGPLLVSAR
ncbi:MAG: hypothetical protein O7B25_10730 [Gammaproteobacteria bacterium]|nr:hypothetical protein [Gammaproteobacteria bacterium]